MKAILPLICSLIISLHPFAQEGIYHDPSKQLITITAQKGNLKILIDYAGGCSISSIYVKGANKLSSAGVYTGFTAGSSVYTSRKLSKAPAILVNGNTVTISGISYGSGLNTINETWRFILTGRAIEWKIIRQYPGAAVLEDIALPQWNFSDLSVWKGGIIDNGGVVWCKYLNTVNDTYGVHTGGTTYWNDKTGDALSIQAKAANGQYIATKYAHSSTGAFTSTQIVSTQPVKQRHHLSRFVHARPDVFAPVAVQKETVSANFTISYVDYFKAYDRGTLKNINAVAVRELLNTTARYGVVDNHIVGGNGWLTNWKCLHEPFFAQVALALADSNYTNNLAATLDQERDLAILPDGRVLSRWHDVPGDEIPGTFNAKTGYYEAQWGYTIDSQTGYVINVSDLFNITGNSAWLKSHQGSCRKALDWLLRRDSNNNGIFEMMNDQCSAAKCSDWLDIVWASFENAFVNAQLYDALLKWAACERVLGNAAAANKYAAIARRLKAAFNKPIEEGGFWSEAKKQFVYWKDKDGTVHGDNLVTPVQFMAIASGLCDNKARIQTIIHQIETRTAAEQLFHWPLCFDSFRREEVSDGNWPFPKYENGDIFPTWGYLGVNAYVHYDKQLAVKYISRLLDQYQKDGLSSQRYSRATQQGLGTDILSGICTGITALYSDIYGIQPRWNRLVLAPNLVPALYGTRFTYSLRNTRYNIFLDKDTYEIATPFYNVSASAKFGVTGEKGSVRFYPNDQDSLFLSISNASKKKITLSVTAFDRPEMRFAIKEAGIYNIVLNGLDPNTTYDLFINGSRQKTISAKEGMLNIRQQIKAAANLLLKRS